MNEKRIQHSLFYMHSQSSMLMIPNYTPAGWWECDLLRITKAGYAEEFEVKVSVSDFKADSKKADDGHTVWRHGVREVVRGPMTKHECLAARDPKGPCRFWFAMPEEIAEQVEIPEWAGLISFGKRSMTGRVIKVAPQLHRQKISDRVIDHAKGVFYYRYWNIRRYAVEDETEVTP